jgi:predicted RNase H-like HicB family nuclease
MRTYRVVAHEAAEEDGGGFWAEVEGMPGCFASGKTLDDLNQDIRGAIEAYVGWLEDHGEPVPEGIGPGEQSWRWDIAVA